MKYFRMSYDDVVFHRSYANIILLNQSIPSYNIDREKDKDEEKIKSEKRSNKEAIIQKSKFKNETELFSSLM